MSSFLAKIDTEVVSSREIAERGLYGPWMLLNGKMERWFRTKKLWQRLSMLTNLPEMAAAHLDVFGKWYDAERPMWVLGGRTPNEMWEGIRLAKAFRARAPHRPIFKVEREAHQDDPYLPVISIELTGMVKRPPKAGRTVAL